MCGQGVKAYCVGWKTGKLTARSQTAGGSTYLCSLFPPRSEVRWYLSIFSSSTHQLGSSQDMTNSIEKSKPYQSTQSSWVWRCTSLIPVLRRQREVDLWDLEASLVYTVAPVSEGEKKKNQEVPQNILFPNLNDR